METPSSTRRVTRSQASALSQKSKQEDTLSRSRNGKNPDRAVLLDITNDSPIVGLATGGLVEKTPSSLVTKNRVRAKQTPGSGEALLRGQVKTLLQKVEEGSELVNKLPLGHRPCALLGLQISPAQLLAPTPANTPQIPGLSAAFKEVVVLMGEMMPCSTDEDDPKNPPQVTETLKQEEPLGPCLLNRALLFDSPGKSEMSDTSTISYQGSGDSYKEKSSEDDNSSAWSLQVNTSIQDEDEEEIEDFDEKAEAEDTHYDEECDDEEEEDEDCYDVLCEVLSKMSVQDTVRLPDFIGKHTWFIYNSDDEIEGEEEVEEKAVSPGVLLLKGLPVPEGKHLRFHEEEEED